MAVKSSSGYRLPPPCNGLNVNFCKNPKCANFGIPEIPHRGYRKKGAAPLPGFYTLDGKKLANGQVESRLKCSICKDSQPIRNNASILGDVDRISAYLKLNPEPTCPNPACEMHSVSLSKGDNNYSAFGKTAAGTPRWRCNCCRKTFTVGGSATSKQKITHKNRDVLMLLMNKMPINRIAEVTGLDNKSIYGKLNFIHRQFMMFAQSREKVLFEDLSLPKMYVAVDRQTHIINWNSRKDRRNISMQAIGTADLNSGYVLGMHLNFDNRMTQAELESLAQEAGDYQKIGANRKYAQYWLKPDYEEAIAKDRANVKVGIATAMQIARGEDKLKNKIEDKYQSAKARIDIEESDEMTDNLMLPLDGVLVKQQYAILSHFIFMSRMLANAPKVRFFLDQDSGFRAAFMSAFADRVKSNTADAWYVSVLKGVNIDKKESLIAQSNRKFKNAKETYPGLTDFEVKLEMVKSEMKRAKSLGYPDDFWLDHPLPTMSEPDKKVCWLTQSGSLPDDHAARLYLRASLHPIDKFFMMARRRISFAERAYASANQAGRKWYGYNAYRPANLAKLLEVFRVFYNYCLAGDDNQTPAMRLGLARGPVAPEDVLYFEPNLTDRAPNPNRTLAKAVPKSKVHEADKWLNAFQKAKPWEF